MTDSIQTNRSIEIRFDDESIIDLNIAIAISTDATGCIADERMRSKHLSKTLETVEFLLITACENSPQKIQEMMGKAETKQ